MSEREKSKSLRRKINSLRERERETDKSKQSLREKNYREREM